LPKGTVALNIPHQLARISQTKNRKRLSLLA
jgi:hypothetical protein